MTPKEKAEEIFNDYYIICQEYTEEIQCSLQAKQCALKEIDNHIRYSFFPVMKSYFQEVKQEINKL